MPETRFDDVRFTMNSILGNLKTSLNLELRDIRPAIEQNISTTDHRIACRTNFVGQEYELCLGIRIGDDGTADTNITVLTVDEATIRLLTEMTITNGSPAIVKEVSIAAISAALTRDARIREAQQAGM